MQTLVRLNIFFFVIYAILESIVFFNFNSEGFSFRTIYSVVTLTVALVLGGFTLTAILQIALRKHFEFLEVISLSSVLSLLALPLLLTLEYSQFGILGHWLPAANSLTLFLFLAILRYTLRKKQSYQTFVENFSWYPNKKVFSHNHLGSILGSAFALYLAVIFTIFSAYYPLPELDPYYWVSQYTSDFSQGKIVEIQSYRPLFSSLTYIFTQAAHIDLYAFFKYIIPSFALLILFPATLVARRFVSVQHKSILLLAPFVSASGTIYLQLPIPQAIATILAFYFLFFLIYSWIVKDVFFYFMAGFIMSLGYFYHEALALPLFIWFAITLFAYRKNIASRFRQDKLADILFIALILSNFSTLISGPLSFLSLWVRQIMPSLVAIQPNFLFPAQYINVDGLSMGWGDFFGVAKYYSYYMGAVIPLAAIFLLTAIWKNEQLRRYLRAEIFSRPPLLVITVNFFLFFALAEVFPRIFSIALLPERAWSFAGIFFLGFVIVAFTFFSKTPRWINNILIVAFLINVSGAIYINQLKQHVITQHQIESAEWIKLHLPEDRIIFSAGNGNLLRFHAQSNVVGVPSKFYYDQSSYDQTVASYKVKRPDISPRYNQFISTYSSIEKELVKRDIETQKQDIASILQKNIEESKGMLSLLQAAAQDNPAPQHLYIYYSKIDPKNPYTDRPYMKADSQIGNKPILLFDRQPDKFRKVYSDERNGIFIWQIL